MDTTIQLRTTKKIKEGARKVFESMGLDLSTRINIYLNQVNKQQSLAVYGLTENGYTPKFEDEILAESKHMKEHPEQYKTYHSAQEIHADILGKDYNVKKI